MWWVKEKSSCNTVMCKNTNSYSPEETSVFHVLCVFIIRFLRTNAHPEEVLWLLPFINYLGDTLMMVLWLHFHCWRHTIFFREFKRETNASISHKWVSHFLYDHFYPHTCRAAEGGGKLSKVATNKFLEVNLKVTMLWSFITAEETYEAVSEKLKIHYLAF